LYEDPQSVRHPEAIRVPQIVLVKTDRKFNDTGRQ
jgi:hypothetical protein